MAKKSKIAAELRRQQVVERYAERRAELKRASVNPHLSQAERDEAMAALHASHCSCMAVEGSAPAWGRPAAVSCNLRKSDQFMNLA